MSVLAPDAYPLVLHCCEMHRANPLKVLAPSNNLWYTIGKSYGGIPKARHFPTYSKGARMFTSNKDITVAFSIIYNNAKMTNKEAVKYIIQNKGVIQLWGTVEIEEEEEYYYDGFDEIQTTEKFIETTNGGTFTYEDGTKISTRINTGYNEGLSYLLAGAGMMNKIIKDYTIELDEAEAGEAVESGYLTFREII